MAQRFRGRRRSGKIISSVLWIKKGYLEEARWLNNSLTCWRRYVILGLSENVLSAGFCLIGYRCLSWRGHRMCFFVDGISVLGGCAISDGSNAYRISGQRLKYKRIIWLTYFSSGLMGFVLYLVFCSYKCSTSCRRGHHRKPYIILTCSLSFLCRSCFGPGQQFQSGIYIVISRLVTLRLLWKRRSGWNFFIFLLSCCNVSKSTCLTIDDPLFWCSLPFPIIPSQHFCGFLPQYSSSAL